MMWTYKAICRTTNKEVRGLLDAPSQAETIQILKRQGLLPIEVHKHQPKKPNRFLTFLKKLALRNP